MIDNERNPDRSRELYQRAKARLMTPAYFMCRYFTADGSCVFNITENTDRIPSVVSGSKYENNSPRFRIFSCGAVVKGREADISAAQTKCDQYKKGTPDSTTRVLHYLIGK